MVIHSSAGSYKRRQKAFLKEQEAKKSVAPKISEKKVVVKEPVKVDESAAVPVVVDDPTAEEFIATLPKKQNRKKVTDKIIEE